MTECTGVAARWCPIHGDCTDRGEKQDGHCDDPQCPLHGHYSQHAASVPPEPPTLPEERAFEYLLNAMELAGQAPMPALEGYGEKRQPVLAFVAALHAEVAARDARAKELETALDQINAEYDRVAGQLKQITDRALNAESDLRTVADANGELETAKTQALEWALDLIDLYDDRLLAHGERYGVVYSDMHVAGKKKARAILAAARSASREDRHA